MERTISIMMKSSSFEIIKETELNEVSGGGGSNIVNWLLSDAFDAYSNMVHYQHMKPSPINN